jgi:solute:Na+ symporter, SSS family
MSILDWTVLLGTLIFIVAYGTWKTRGSRDLEGYLKGGNDANWWGIGISIMATQASAITFLSTPGQAYTDGMRFVQFYFGLPVAMIILSVTFIPIFYRLKVYTAYEFLESRFDLKTRTLASLLFLVQRGLAAGITIYAPAIILSTLLGWNLTATNVLIGALVIIYTVSGGTRAVTQTQKQQMAVMMGGMLLAGGMVVAMLPADISLNDAFHVAGKTGRLNVVNFEFNLSDRYNFWSGMTAALFLFMSYFGTDQSQVQRYITGQEHHREPPRADDEWPAEGADAVRHPAHRGDGVRVLPVPPAARVLQPRADREPAPERAWRAVGGAGGRLHR